MSRTRLKIVGAAAAAAVAAGGGAAYATTRSTEDSPSTERQAFLADVASRLGVSVDDLRRAIRDAAAARGWPQGRAFGPFGRGPGFDRGPRFGPGRHFDAGPGHAVHESFKAAADYLGLSPGQLIQQLRAGESLADVAKAQGKSVDGLKQAIHDALAKKLDAAVVEGRMTKAEEQQFLDRLDAIIDDLVNRSRPPGRPGPPF